MSVWYKELFDNYARTYDKEPFTQGTLGEVDFIEKELNLDKSKTILDIGCGTGRHAIELTKRGYKVTGVDLSESQLQRAREKAKENGVEVKFIREDARDLNFKNEFDLVMLICEGAFPLMETDEMNFKILENASKALRTNGKLILTTLSALYPLYHSVKDFINSSAGEGVSSANSFDLKTFRETSIFDVTDDDGKNRTLSCNERYYIPSEISWYLKSLHFKTIDIYGCKLGAFSRSKQLTTDDFEMLVVAVK
jgi:cyclopropane fatty-acyl-phospholipid synthase-like methyltransferase